MTIRKVRDTNEDCDLVFSLSNDPVVRLNSFNSEPIIYNNHVNWFKNVVKDSKYLFFLIFEDERFVGQIRFYLETNDSDCCIISLSIAKDFRGKGFAQDFLKLGIESMMKEWFFIRKIIAEVKVENIASNKMFTKYGFSFVEKKAIKNLYELNIEK